MLIDTTHEDEYPNLVSPNCLHADTPSPAIARATSVVGFAREVLLKETDEQRRVDLVRAHIEGRELQLVQLSALHRNVSRNIYSEDAAALLVAGVCKRMLIHAPITSRHDVRSMLEIVEGPGDLPAGEQAIVTRRLNRFVVDAAAGKPFAPDRVFESNGQMIAAEKIEGRVTVGDDCLFEDADRLYTESGWARATVISVAERSVLIQFPNGEKVRVGEKGHPRATTFLVPAYRITARYATPPMPRYVRIAANTDGLWFPETRIAIAEPTERVIRRNWYLLATRDGTIERLQIVTLAGANATTLYVVKGADKHQQLSRKGWRLYRITTWMAESEATDAMKAAAILYEPAGLNVKPKKDKAPKSVVVAAFAGKRREAGTRAAR